MQCSVVRCSALGMSYIGAPPSLGTLRYTYMYLYPALYIRYLCIPTVRSRYASVYCTLLSNVFTYIPKVGTSINRVDTVHLLSKTLMYILLLFLFLGGTILL